MAGGGRFGPLPLGLAAMQADSEDVQEAVAAQDEHGFGASQALWKWACYQVCVRLPKAEPAHFSWPAQYMTVCDFNCHHQTTGTEQNEHGSGDIEA